MRAVRRFLLILCLAAGFADALRAADSQALFDSANALLAQGKAVEAARLYEQITATGLTSPALERNWAQASFQNGQPGAALFHLRRAERLSPRDENVRADLALLRSKLNFSPTGTDWSALGWLRLDEWAWLALAAVWIWFALLFAAKLSPRARNAVRGFAFGSGVVALGLVAALFAAAQRQFHEPDAIVLNADTPLRQSPLDEAKVTLNLPAATELAVRDAKDGWLMVEEPTAQRFGWVRRAQVVRVSGPAAAERN
jgi:hypothetical protein